MVKSQCYKSAATGRHAPGTDGRGAIMNAWGFDDPPSRTLETVLPSVGFARGLLGRCGVLIRRHERTDERIAGHHPHALDHRIDDDDDRTGGHGYVDRPDVLDDERIAGHHPHATEHYSHQHGDDDDSPRV